MTQTTDKDLLELAAKAAGIEITGLVDKIIAQPDHRTGGFIVVNNRYGSSLWNPLTDDGDALRLAVKLRLHISVFADAIGIGTSGKGYEELRWTDDPYAATRRAIVRAAATIGESM